MEYVDFLVTMAIVLFQTKVEPDCLEITCFESSRKTLREALVLTFGSMTWTDLDILEIFLLKYNVLGTIPGLHFLFKSYFSLWQIAIF